MAFLTYPAAADNTEDKAREIKELSDFVAAAPDQYNGGMTLVAENHVMRETAKYYGCDFADIAFPQNLATALNEQKNSPNDILLCSSQPINKDTAADDLKKLTTALQGIKMANKHKKTLIPIGATGYGVGHMMTLAIEGDKACIFEQFGGTSAYGEVKKDLAQALSAAGYTVSVNTNPLTNGNRLDCATVSNKIIFEAMQADSIDTLLQQTNQKSPLFSHEEINDQHKIDQQFARLALKDINEGHRDDRNNNADIILLQKLLDKCKGNLGARLKLAEEFWKAEDKAKFVAEYQPQQNQDELNVDDKVDSPAHDDGWKDEVRKAVAQAKQNVKTNFEEYQDAEHPEHLCFRDGNDKMIFSSRNKVAVEGDMQTFRTLCDTAQNLGYKAINFGKFEEHPEYKAKLYLACLEKDLKMNNAPKLEELKDYPEYKDIMKLYIPQKRKELSAALKASAAEFNKANAEANGDTEYKRLKKELQEAKKNKDNDAVEKAKEALAANPIAQKLDKATAAYKNAMKASINFYIDYGSENSKADETPEARRKKVERHLTEYDADKFFEQEWISQKDLADGKTPAPRTPQKGEKEKYASAQRIAREVMNIKRAR